MPRRRRRDASQNADGRWHMWVTIGTRPDGRALRRHVKRATQAEAEDEADRLRDAVKAGRVTRAGAKPTVQSWMTTYLTKVAPQRCTAGTIYDYESKMRNWVYPTYAAKRLDLFAPEDLDDVYTKMKAAGKAQSHQLKVHRILSRALDIAHRRGYVSRNVAKLVDPPTVDPVTTKALAEEVALKILAAVDDGERRNPARWSAAFAMGLRQGEALGLRWEDPADGTPLVDLDAGLMRVWYQLRREVYRHGCGNACGRKRGAECPQRSGGGLVYRKCKGKSRRTIPIPPELVPTLKTARTRQRVERLACGNQWAAGSAVFTTVDGRLIDPGVDYREWNDILILAGIKKVKPHIMRHTAATLLLAQKVDVRVVQELLGHRDVHTTQGYTQDVDVLLFAAMKKTLLRPGKRKAHKTKGALKGALHAVE